MLLTSTPFSFYTPPNLVSPAHPLIPKHITTLFSTKSPFSPIQSPPKRLLATTKPPPGKFLRQDYLVVCSLLTNFVCNLRFDR